jgi:hypothetical protein
MGLYAKFKHEEGPLESEIAKIKNRGNIIFPGKITEYDS